MSTLDSKIPDGPLADKWTKYKDHINLVNPANKRNIDVIVVGTGLAGGSAAATLAELGYNVKAFAYQDSPRRAHSIAAQGGINAAKNYMGDGDSIYRLFYDTVKGGDYRAREANVYRLAEVSGNIIDQCVAQGVPFARDYGGLLDNRSFGGVLVSRTFYAKGQTGQQLLLGCYAAMNRQIARGKIDMYNRHEMLDVVIVDGKARGIIARNLVTGEIERHSAHAVVIASGGYGNVYFLQNMLKTRNIDLKGKTVLVSGSGNVAQYTIEKLLELGAKPLTCSDSDGCIYDPDGIDEEKLAYIMELKNIERGRIREYAEKYNVKYVPGGRPWCEKADIATPCATQNEINGEAAAELVKNGVIAVTEGANMPSTPEAVKIFQDAKVLYCPGKASNAGGVAVSGLEMSQNSGRLKWSREEVDQKLHQIMDDIHANCVKYGTEPDGYINYVKGANVAGFIKVAKAMMAQGVI